MPVSKFTFLHFCFLGNDFEKEARDALFVLTFIRFKKVIGGGTKRRKGPFVVFLHVGSLQRNQCFKGRFFIIPPFVSLTMFITTKAAGSIFSISVFNLLSSSLVTTVYIISTSLVSPRLP